jgi:hypothetical protein
MDLAVENMVIKALMEDGRFDLLDEYISTAYDNSGDYYFKKGYTVTALQNMQKFRDIPLLNGKSKEEVEATNRNRIDDAFSAYIADEAMNAGYDDIYEYVLSNGNTLSGLMKEFEQDQNLLKKYGVTLDKYESIYSDGCMLVSLKYMLDQITGFDYDIEALNRFALENHYYEKDNELSAEKLETILNKATYGYYDITLVYNQKTDMNVLMGYGLSKTMYVAHLRVNQSGTVGNGITAHSVAFNDSIDIYTGQNGVVGALSFNVANPALGNKTFNGAASYSVDNIGRWDVFEVKPTLKYYVEQNYYSITMRYANPLAK